MKLKIKNREIEIKIIDNKAKITLLCVHGFSSNKNFIKTLGTNNENFNIVSYSVPVIEDMSVDYMVEIAKIVLKRIKNSRVYVLGHSLGGAVLSRLHNHKIKRYFFVSPIHPYLTQFRPYKILKAAYEPQSIFQNVMGSVAMAAVKKIPNNDFAVDFDSPWFNIVRNELIKEEFMQKLDEDLKKINNPTFFVGDDDRIISTKHLLKFVEEELHLQAIVLEGKHNIFDNIMLSELLNKSISFKKRLFFKFRKIFRL